MLLSLPQRALVHISGDEAGDFLNDLITADINKLPSDTIQPAALLTPQGRILDDMLISRQSDGFTIEIDTTRRDGLIKKLMMYRLRRQVNIVEDNRSVQVHIEGKGLKDKRFDTPVFRYYSNIETHGQDDSFSWQAYRYRHGVPEGMADMPPEKALPLEARLDLNGGVSFEKGCYIGQEVTARTHYRGLIKRCYLPVVASSMVNAPQDIKVSDKNKGVLLGMAEDDEGIIGLASIRLEALTEDTSFMAGDARLTPIYPERLMPLPSRKTPINRQS